MSPLSGSSYKINLLPWSRGTHIPLYMSFSKQRWTPLIHIWSEDPPIHLGLRYPKASGIVVRNVFAVVLDPISYTPPLVDSIILCLRKRGVPHNPGLAVYVRIRTAVCPSRWRHCCSRGLRPGTQSPTDSSHTLDRLLLVFDIRCSLPSLLSYCANDPALLTRQILFS